jgi:hypothetical protein
MSACLYGELGTDADGALGRRCLQESLLALARRPGPWIWRAGPDAGRRMALIAEVPTGAARGPERGTPQQQPLRQAIAALMYA